MIWNVRWLWIQWRGNVLHLALIWGTPIYFAFLRWHQCSSVVVTVFLEILFSSIREMEVPYGFDWEHGTPPHEMQGNRASSCGEGEVSWVFSSGGRHLVYILELGRAWPFETRVCSAKSGLLSRYDGHLGKSNYAWQENTDASGGEPGGQASLISWHSYTDIPIIYHEVSSIVVLKHWTQRTSRSLKWMWGLLCRRGWELWLSLGSPQGIQSSLHLVRWKMSLHLRHCRESWPSFESGHLGVHFNWGRKQRVTLIY